MSPLSIGVLAVSMSVDAFVASLGRGASQARPSLGVALRTGALFGLVEALFPVLGWAAGLASSRYVAAVDHWIAFALLAAVGLHMVLQARRPADAAPQGHMPVWSVLATAVATSIDALAVGVSLAVLQVNIVVIALATGLTTMVLSATGLLAGRRLGHRFGRWAETFGGIALVGLGLTILLRHLAG